VSSLDDQIKAFLQFGYLPHVPEGVELEPWAEPRNEFYDPELSSLSEDELIERGVVALQAPYRDLDPNETYVVSLSGGLDSRSILGGLINAGLKDNIVTVTYGTPGTYDFDIGKQISKQMGLKHELIDLTTVTLEQSFFESVAASVDSWFWLFDAYFIRHMTKKMGSKPIYMSGHVGDDLGGAYIPKEASTTWHDAQTRFIKRNRFVKSIKLAPEGYDPRSYLPAEPILGNSTLDYDDQIHLIPRQEGYIRKLLLPVGLRHVTPFTNREWERFILSVPRHYRQKLYLYEKILLKAYPDLFQIRIKGKKGLKLDAPEWQLMCKSVVNRSKLILGDLFPGGNWSINPNLNYIDFENGIRNRPDLKEIVSTNVQALKARGVVSWIDIDRLWKMHLNSDANYSDALTLLTSLELHLKKLD